MQKPSNDLENDGPEAPSVSETENVASAASTRSEAQRERLRQSQAIAAQVIRAQAAGGAPNDEQAARLIAEFQARGGRITVCPPSDAASLDGQESSNPGRRAVA
jgi:hypothetical protein